MNEYAAEESERPELHPRATGRTSTKQIKLVLLGELLWNPSKQTTLPCPGHHIVTLYYYTLYSSG